MTVTTTAAAAAPPTGAAGGRAARIAGPKAGRARLSLRARTLLIASAGVTAILLGDAALGARAALEAGRAALAERAGLLATIQADALAVPLWDFDDEQVEGILDALALDPGFGGASLVDAAGDRIAERAGPAAAGAPTVGARRDVTTLDRGERRTLGTLEVRLATDRPGTALRREVQSRAASLVALVGAVLLAVHGAFRQVTRPLDVMAGVTCRLATGDRAVAVPGLERADEVGAVARAIQTFKENAVALALAEEEYRALYENAALGIYRAAPDGRIVAANPALVRLSGCSSEGELLDALNDPGAGSPGRYVEPGRRDELRRLRGERGGFVGLVSQIVRRDGSIAWISETSRAVRGPSGEVLGHAGTVEDVTERKRLEAEERLRVRAAIESAGDAILIADGDGAPVFVNPAFVRLFGRGLDELAAAGGLPAVLGGGALAREVAAELGRCGQWGGEAEVAVAGGRTVPMAVRASAIAGDGGGAAAVGSVLICTDVSSRVEAEARIRHMAHHDALTGLPNRVLFRERLQAALEPGRRRDDVAAVLCLDLDRFKEVNDTLGHAAGDRLLQAVAARLGAAVRDGDTVARLGGDEFAIVQVGGAQPEAAEALARRLVDELSRPFDLDGHEAVIGASVGVALAPDHGADPERLLRRADVALYRAKGAGRGTHRLFEPEMDAAVRARGALERDLRRAVAEGGLELHYQPQVELETGRLVGAEALLRWHHPERGPVPPAEFIPIAEETGLIAPLGEWALRAACAEAASWPLPLRVAVNLSPAQFRAPDLAGTVGRVLRETGLPPHRLELEITEGVLLRDTEATVATLDGLRAGGVRIAMDDFGTGYSSLGYLRRLPFDKIKIDRSFIKGLGREPGAGALVRSIVGMGRGLGMATNAEGVETAEQAAHLRAEGCEEAQGYHFARPMPARDLVGLMADPLRAAA